MKTQEQVSIEIKNYLNKTSNHLFVTESGHMYKIQSFEREAKLYYAAITLGKGVVSINVKEALHDRTYAWYGNNSLDVLKAVVFPSYQKSKSIPYFKKMRELMTELMAEIQIDNSLNKDLVEKIKTMLPQLEKTI
jgi:hypothetical protein